MGLKGSYELGVGVTANVHCHFPVCALSLDDCCSTGIRFSLYGAKASSYDAFWFHRGETVALLAKSLTGDHTVGKWPRS